MVFFGERTLQDLEQIGLLSKHVKTQSFQPVFTRIIKIPGNSILLPGFILFPPVKFYGYFSTRILSVFYPYLSVFHP